MKIFLIIALLTASIFAMDVNKPSQNLVTQVKEKKSSWRKFVRKFDVTRHGKKVYAKVKSNIKRLKSKVLNKDKHKVVHTTLEDKTKSENRKKSVLQQFIAKADILETQRVKKEIINVEDEIISFFNSFKYQKKNPINIE